MGQDPRVRLQRNILRKSESSDGNGSSFLGLGPGRDFRFLLGSGSGSNLKLFYSVENQYFSVFLSFFPRASFGLGQNFGFGPGRACKNAFGVSGFRARAQPVSITIRKVFNKTSFSKAEVLQKKRLSPRKEVEITL